MSLAPQAGLTTVDGVLAVDPQGLAALLELTGPVDVVGWPTPISAENVVKVTLRDAYAAFAETPERADFLGDVAQVAVDEATSGNLGRPAQIAKVLGAAAHAGHLILAFARPEEQELAVELGVSGRMEPVRSDAVAVTTSNAGANKIDYYLQRSVRYTVKLAPNARRHPSPRVELARRHAREHRHRQGLPQIVIGPYDPRFYAGREPRVGVDLLAVAGDRHRDQRQEGRRVSRSRAGAQRLLPLHGDPGTEQFEHRHRSSRAMSRCTTGGTTSRSATSRRSCPTGSRFRSTCPKGWRIDKAPGMDRPFAGRATSTLLLDKTTTFRVHIWCATRERGTSGRGWRRASDPRAVHRQPVPIAARGRGAARAPRRP